MAFKVWDDESGNVIANCESLDEASSFLHGLLKENGPSGVRELAVVEYPNDGTDPTTVLEGVDFLTQQRISV